MASPAETKGPHMDTLRLLLISENDRKWFEVRRQEFEEKYKDMFVAVKDRNVVATGTDLDETIAQLRKRKLDPGLVIIEFVSSEGQGTVL